jgi:hypothetical protein
MQPMLGGRTDDVRRNLRCNVYSLGPLLVVLPLLIG